MGNSVTPLSTASIAVAAAMEALRRDDQDSIGDALVGLTAAKLQHLELFERLQSASDTLRPSFAEQLSETWRDTCESASHQRAMKLFVTQDQLPALRARPSLDIELPVIAILQALKRELTKGPALGLVALLPKVATAESLDRFALGLAATWQSAGAKSSERWAFEAMGLLGGDRCAELIGQNLELWTHKRAVQGLQMLRRIGTHQALFDIWALAIRRGKYPPRRREAARIFEHLAEDNSISTWTLACRCLPSWGNEHARSRFEETLILTLQLAMLEGGAARISAADFDSYLVRHPLGCEVARQVVWGIYEGSSVTETFGVGSRFELFNVRGKPLVLPTNGSQIGPIHPLEILEKQRNAWTDRFSRLGICQPFLQLQRPLFALEQSEANSDAIVRFADRRVGLDRIEPKLVELGWRREEQESYFRTLPRSAATAEAQLQYYAGNIAQVTAFQGSYVGSGRERIPLSELDKVDVSELLHELEIATCG